MYENPKDYHIKVKDDTSNCFGLVKFVWNDRIKKIYQFKHLYRKEELIGLSNSNDIFTDLSVDKLFYYYDKYDEKEIIKNQIESEVDEKGVNTYCKKFTPFLLSKLDNLIN